MAGAAEYSIRPARYAGRWNGKPQLAVHCVGNGTGMKDRAQRLIGDGLKGRYSGRERAYIVSPSKAAKFEQLFAEGWDANSWSGALIAPPLVTEVHTNMARVA
jgi:hypothetical protein